MHRQLLQGWRTLIAIGGSAALTATIAAAVDPVGPFGAEARYQQERAACESGQSQQDRATCLREAGAALQEARQGRLADGPARYQQNELARCGYLPAEERSACHARMQGQGTTSGSVAAGGIYREYREYVTGEAPTAGASAR
jgi:hypothetical protein